MHNANTLRGQFNMCKLMRKQCWHFLLVYDLPYASCTEPCPYVFTEDNPHTSHWEHRCTLLHMLPHCLT